MDFYQGLFLDASFFDLLARIDEDLREESRGRGCGWCGGALHSARYPRKPRGGPPGAEKGCRRESLCCAEDGCRKRTLPPSVRFLGRRVFFGLVVILVPILREGMTATRFADLVKRLPVSRRTVQRWRRWWREHFPTTHRWQRGRAEAPLVAEADLPSSLVASFSGGPREQALVVLRWLADPAPHGRDR